MWRRKIGIRPRDFIGLGLSDGKLQLIYTDTDIKEMNLATHEDWFQCVESKARVDDGRWHTATVRRRKRLAMLQVDDTPPVRGYSQSLLVPSKANPKLWIGMYFFLLTTFLINRIYVQLRLALLPVNDKSFHIFDLFSIQLTVQINIIEYLRIQNE